MPEGNQSGLKHVVLQYSLRTCPVIGIFQALQQAPPLLSFPRQLSLYAANHGAPTSSAAAYTKPYIQHPISCNRLPTSEIWVIFDALVLK